jgi:hypothetical protein
MPTIELARLKQETAQLSEYFSEPATYIRGLEHLLQNYAVPVHRQGQVKGMRPVLKSYEIPPPLLKHLQIELAEQARQAPQVALAVADGLWARRTIETRQLAARLLGVIEATPQELIARLESWADENYEPTLAPELAQQATLNLSVKHPEQLILFAQRLLTSGDLRKQAFALGMLRTLLDGAQFANLPAIFEILSEVARVADRKLRPDLADLLGALAQRSPKETEYFIEQGLETGADPGRQWVARRVMKALPADSQQRLRTILKA